MAYVVNNYIPLPSPDNDPYNFVKGINDSGTISGYTAAIGAEVAYTLSPTETFSFPSNLDWTITIVGGITNNGTVVGLATEPDTVPFGFVDNNGVFTALPSGQYGSELTGMNDAGEAVGYNLDAQRDTHPFLYNVATGAETPITIQGLSDVLVTGINDSGQMVGSGLNPSAHEEAFYLDGKGGSELVAPPGAISTSPKGLNNAGQVVGDYIDSAGKTHGFLFDLATNAYTTLDVPSATSTVATSINNTGQVVGYYTDAQSAHGFEALIAHT